MLGFFQSGISLCLFSALHAVLLDRKDNKPAKRGSNRIFAVFYAWGEPVYLFLMLGTVFADISLQLGIEKFRGTKQASFV